MSLNKKCIKKCKLNNKNICIGCGRTIEEIVSAGNKAKKLLKNNLKININEE